MVELASLWYAITLVGAPEIWSMFALVLFVILMGLRVINKGRRDRKTKHDLRELLEILVPALIITFLLVIVIKGFLTVPRECVPCIAELTGCNPFCPVDSSFPSGHAATAFAGFTAIWLYTGSRKKWLLIYVITVLVAVSRIMLGVHTWVDVFVGAILGITVSFVVQEIDRSL
jgi:membrane-associated phospholipid phosphatase